MFPPSQANDINIEALSGICGYVFRLFLSHFIVEVLYFKFMFIK